MKKPLGMNKSFIISLFFHIMLLTFIMLALSGRPLITENEPVTINLEPLDESISKGLGENIYEPPVKVNENHEERKSKEPEKTIAPDETSAADETPLDNVKKNIIADTEGQLNKESGDTDNGRALQEKLSNDLIRAEAKQKIDQEMKDIFGALEQGQGRRSNYREAYPSGDPLGDASWSSRPRRTTFFPDIQSKIPEQFRKKGLSYSITVKLTFDKNGLASGAEIISSSGDPEIDAIFSSELRKIRVEPITEDRRDEIIKVFKISLK